MPLYSYKCTKCGYKFDTHVCIAQRNQTQECPECLGPSARDVEEELNGSHQDVTDHPRWSWAMGVHVSQIPEMMRLYPDREYNHKGQLLVKNRQQKVKYMREHGRDD